MIRKRLFISIAIFSSFITIITAQAKEDLQNTSIDSLPKVAVFLSGGAARGLCHLGFLSVLEEYEIPIDIIVGASMGSIVGGYYAYGYSIDDLLNKVREFSIISLIDFKHPKDGFLSGQKLEALFQRDIDNVRIEELPIPLAIISTDLDTGNLFVFDEGHLYKAMRASSAIPGIFDPVFYKEKRLIDGGILSIDPVNIAKQMNADIIIVSDVSISTMMDDNRILKNINRIVLKYISENKGRLIFKEDLQQNTIASILLNTLLIIEKNQKIKLGCEESKPDFIIEPVRSEIIFFDFYKVDEGYELGRKAALEIIDEIVKKVYK